MIVHATNNFRFPHEPTALHCIFRGYFSIQELPMCQQPDIAVMIKLLAGMDKEMPHKVSRPCPVLNILAMEDRPRPGLSY